MAKFYGPIGFAEVKETAPGVYKDKIVERNYSGDLLANSLRYQSGDQVNDNLVLGNRISILADPYARNNFHTIRYVGFMGTKWKVNSVDAAQYPRLVLTLGGVYNG